MSKPKAPTIIFLGDPAAGKATQAAFVAKRFNLYDFDMGKQLTVIRQRNPKISAILKKNYDQGKITPSYIVQKILRDTIKSVSKSKGILFDGHPKMLAEAKVAIKELKKSGRPEPVVIYLTIPLEETVKRMHNRIGYSNGKYGKRSDDTKEALRNRSKYYRVNIAAVVKYFSSHYPYKKINGLGTVQQVKKRVNSALEKMIQ